MCARTGMQPRRSGWGIQGGESADGGRMEGRAENMSTAEMTSDEVQ